MKRFELIFTFLKLPFDFLMIVLGGFCAFGLRFTEFITSIKPVLFSLSWESYWPAVVITAAGWVVIYAFAGLYRSDPNQKLLPEISRVIMASAVGFAGITIFVFFTLQKFDSRFLVLVGWLLATLFVMTERILLRAVKMYFYRLGFGRRRTIIIGNETIAHQIEQTFKHKSGLGYTVVGKFSNFNDRTKTRILSLKPDEIIYTNPKTNEHEALSAIDFANEFHITFKYSADIFATISTNMTVSAIAGIPIIELRRTPLDGWGKINKRIFDIFFSLFFIVLFSPLYIIVAIAILLETGRPIIYKNRRVGGLEKLFNTLKFRSMYKEVSTGEQFGGEAALKKEAALIKQSSIKAGPVYKIKNDPRVTKVGRFIRKWSLDELPQFFNILKGDMSLVGPRPHQPREVAQYEKHHKAVLAIKPGLTGMAQISGRSNLSFEDEVKIDTFYIEHWTLLLDIVILIKTPFAVIFKKGAL